MLYSELAGRWQKCCSACDRIEEMASQQTRNFLDQQFKPVGSSATSSVKAGHKLDQIAVLPERAKPLSPKLSNRPNRQKRQPGFRIGPNLRTMTSAAKTSRHLPQCSKIQTRCPLMKHRFQISSSLVLNRATVFQGPNGHRRPAHFLATLNPPRRQPPPQVPS